MNFDAARDHLVEAVRHVPANLGIPLADLVAKARIRRGKMEIAVFDSRDLAVGAFVRASIPAQPGLSTKAAEAMIETAIRASSPLSQAMAAVRRELLGNNVTLFPRNAA